MSAEELRRRYIREIADQLGQVIEEFGEHPEEADFLNVTRRRLGETEPNTPELAALESVTWDEIREDLYG